MTHWATPGIEEGEMLERIGGKKLIRVVALCPLRRQQNTNKTAPK